MEDLVSLMSEFSLGPNCSPEGCSNFADCPALRLGNKLNGIATSEVQITRALEWGIYDWSYHPEGLQRRVEQLNTAVKACTGWEEAGKQTFEASSLCVSKGSLGKGLVIVDRITSNAAIKVGLPSTVYLKAPTLPAEPEDVPDHPRMSLR